MTEKELQEISNWSNAERARLGQITRVELVRGTTHTYDANFTIQTLIGEIRRLKHKTRRRQHDRGTKQRS
jgi:hypothetical protein